MGMGMAMAKMKPRNAVVNPPVSQSAGSELGTSRAPTLQSPSCNRVCLLRVQLVNGKPKKSRGAKTRVYRRRAQGLLLGNLTARTMEV